MAVFGHSGSQAPQLMHSEVIIVAMAASRHTFPQAAAQARDGEAGAAGTPRSRQKRDGHSAPVVVPGRMRVGWGAVRAVLDGLACNSRLGCGRRGQPGRPPFTPVVVDIATQLGLEQQVTVMRAAFLCAPAKKTGGGVAPLPPTAVPHFTCYRPKRGDKRNVTVQLTDQFGSGVYTITSRRLLCAPSVKMLGSPSGAFLPL